MVGNIFMYFWGLDTTFYVGETFESYQASIVFQPYFVRTLFQLSMARTDLYQWLFCVQTGYGKNTVLAKAAPNSILSIILRPEVVVVGLLDGWVDAAKLILSQL